MRPKIINKDLNKERPRGERGKTKFCPHFVPLGDHFILKSLKITGSAN
jgi:hypothetical protein